MKITEIELPVRIALSPRQVEAAATCGISADEYARRIVIQASDGSRLYPGMWSVLSPIGANLFEVKEIHI